MRSYFKMNAFAVTALMSLFHEQEIRGVEYNPVIISWAKILGFTSYKSDETPWCSLFMNYVLYLIGKTGTGSLAAISFEKFGIEVVGEPQIGDIVVFFRDPVRREKSWMRHVGIYLRDTPLQPDWILVGGGNENNMVSVESLKKSNISAIRRIPE